VAKSRIKKKNRKIDKKKLKKSVNQTLLLVKMAQEA
jgi:hypothetical protein